MKVIWKGSIAFGLVNIPIELYSAREAHSLAFTLLHEKCHTPLKNHRWCPHCKKDVLWDQTVKGIKKTNGQYLILTQEAIKALHPETTRQIEIVEFIDHDLIDPIYSNNHYYIKPSKGSDTAYALFTTALINQNKVAIGRFVMRDKEYVCMLQPFDNYLLLTTLHYEHEIRGIEDLEFTKKVKLSSAELKLAETFVKKMSAKKFDMSKFKDTFAQQIKTLLKKKTTKGKVIKAEAVKRTSKKSSLIESLRANVECSSRPVAYAKSKKK